MSAAFDQLVAAPPTFDVPPAAGADRDAWAAWFAGQHLKCDPSISAVVYLPHGADGEEIRFVELSDAVAGRTDEAVRQVMTFGVGRDTGGSHVLAIVDATPEHWDRMRAGTLAPPDGWEIASGRVFEADPVPARAAA